MTIDPVISWIIALTLIQIFASAVWHKIQDLHNFSRVLVNYQLLPGADKKSVALSLVALEALVVILLVATSTRAAGAAIAIFLLLSYACAMAINLIRNRSHLDCGCHFGKDKKSISWALVQRNIALIALTCVLFILPESRAFNWLDMGSIIFGFITCSLIYISANALCQNRTLFDNGSHHD